MKKIILLLTICIALIACNKDNEISKVNFQPEKMLFESPESEISVLIEHPEDAADEIINERMYDFAQAFISLMDNTTLIDQVLSDLNSQDDKSLTMAEMAAESSTIDSAFYDEGVDPNQTDTIREIEYYYELFLFNDSLCDFSKTPIIALGTSVDYSFSDSVDYLPGWEFDSSYNTTEILINEYNADNMDNPLLIIMPVTDEVIDSSESVKSNNYSKSTNPHSRSVQTNDDVEFKINRFKIQHRYERCSYSQYRVNYQFCYTPIPSLNIYYQSTARMQHTKWVHKNNVGYFRYWSPLITNVPEPNWTIDYDWTTWYFYFYFV
jgi:hypothetical protein